MIYQYRLYTVKEPSIMKLVMGIYIQYSDKLSIISQKTYVTSVVLP
jgi:hypothetical protein